METLANDLVASAYSPDGIVEAFEWKEPNDKPFLLAVQWHPERLDFNSLLSKPIANAFIDASKQYDIKHK